MAAREAAGGDILRPRMVRTRVAFPELALRYILSNDGITAPIPGLISIRQVKNAVRAIVERRQFDLADAEPLDQQLEPVRGEMWANLSPEYQWLKNWEWV